MYSTKHAFRLVFWGVGNESVVESWPSTLVSPTEVSELISQLIISMPMAYCWAGATLTECGLGALEGRVSYIRVI